MQYLQDVICEKKRYSGVPNTHEHNFVQMIFPLVGSMEIQTERYSKKVDEDFIFIIPNECMHTYNAHKRNEFLVVDIPAYFIDLPNLGAGVYFKMNEFWRSIRFLLLEELVSNNGNSKAIYHIVRLIGEKVKSNITLQSVEYIHNHFSTSIQIEKLASLENLHPVYYAQWFKKRMGKSPISYIQEIRLKEAKKLLVGTDLSITNISLQVGYNQLSSLSRLFYKYEGLSPRIYRYNNSSKKEQA